MDIEAVNAGGLVLLGCGRMGSALLEGWLAHGVRPEALTVLDPHPSDRLRMLEGQGLRLNASVTGARVCVLAVKPQIIAAAQDLVALGNGTTLFVSVAAGIELTTLEGLLGAEGPIIRSMPNLPAAIGKGVTAYIGNRACGIEDLALGAGLLGAVGKAVRLEREDQMDAVTGLSGSGPAYLFHMIEALAEAGQAEGLSPDLAQALALETVAGAAALAATSAKSPTELRRDVTSPNGTTAAGLDVLMAEPGGLCDLIRATVHAAADRSRDLAKS